MNDRPNEQPSQIEPNQIKMSLPECISGSSPETMEKNGHHLKGTCLKYQINPICVPKGHKTCNVNAHIAICVCMCSCSLSM